MENLIYIFAAYFIISALTSILINLRNNVKSLLMKIIYIIIWPYYFIKVLPNPSRTDL
jgi:hypothetical protein